MAKKPFKFDSGEIYNEERYLIAKELMGPLNAIKAVILSEQK